MRYTLPQQNAIQARNRELLVSAAAGSGKTKVLVERIFRLAAQEGYQLDRMLVVTFTNAAAAEMRERLEARFEEGASENESLRRQAERVENAQISTLHSFCQKLIREFFEVAGIDPLAGLAEETLQKKLLEQAAQEALEESYELAKEDPQLFSLTQKFSPQEIGGMLLELYRFLLSLPHPFQWLANCAQHSYTLEDLDKGPMTQVLLRDCRVILDGALALWQQAAPLAQDPFCQEGYARILEADGQLLSTLQHAAQEGLTALLQATASSGFSRMPGIKLVEPPEINVRETLKEFRDRYKKRLEEMKKLLPQDGDRSIADLQAMAAPLRGLAKAVESLHNKYGRLKAERNVIDFSDLEHMAIAILSRPELQKSISGRFDAIFVDEYQDISEIQEAILQALKPEEEKSTPQEEGREDAGNSRPPFTCFYVGDVKQSIYRFRQADPTLFMEKLERFGEAENSPQRKISLSHNFRSREAVLSAVNRVFSHVMQGDVTEIDYDENASLYPGRPSLGDPLPQVHLMDSREVKAADQPREEALFIAGEIQRLLREPILDWEGKEAAPLTYRDMAILLPVARGKASLAEQVLQEAGIPVYCEDNSANGESPEITQTLAHLRLLDNLMDDLSLLTVLRGPHYRLSEEELGAIRLQKPDPKASFLEALMAAAQAKPENALAKRCRDILAELKQERFLEQSMPLDEYLWSFLNRSGLYGFFGTSAGGKLRQANLRMLCHQAGEYVTQRGGSLHDFLDSLTNRQGVHDGKSPTVVSPNENVVRIMTIHKSKGLEFPVVFVMGLGGSLLRRGGGSALQMHSKLGVSLPYINEKARTKRATLLGSAISLRKAMEERAERARVLYVAMTRAKDRLYLIGSSSSLTAQALAGGVPPGAGELSPAFAMENPQGKAYAVWEARSMLEWVWQSIQNTDEIRVCGPDDLSTGPLWETGSKTQFSTDSTFFPQKNGVWRVVFHNGAVVARVSENVEKISTAKASPEKGFSENPLQELLSSLTLGIPSSQEVALEAPSKALPVPVPLKMGVTALCRSLEKESKEGLEPLLLADQPDPEAESVEIKRLPLPLTVPRRLSELPTLPAYLRGSPPQTAVLRGVATHKALSLLPFEPLREAVLPENGKEGVSSGLSSLDLSLQNLLPGMLLALEREGKLTPQERELIHMPALAKFFASPLGLRTLASQEVHREWSFNLRLPQLSQSILQGVIDLCFLENGAWVLVDFKTDRVKEVRDLWPLYHRQIHIYRRALASSTRYPVGESVLFSLHLGEGHSMDSGEGGPFA